MVGGLDRQLRHHVVGYEDADDVGVARGLDVVRFEAVLDGLLARLVASDAHRRPAAAVAQVERPRPPLVAVADDGDVLSRDCAHVAVTFVVDRRHLGSSSAV
jgi:hypothetical protein